MSDLSVSYPVLLLLGLALAAPALPGCPTSGGRRGGGSGSTSGADDDDSAGDDDDATGDDDDATGDDDDATGDDDDATGDDDDSTPDGVQTVFVASPSLVGGVSTRISEPDGTVLWTGVGDEEVGGLGCGPTPGSLLAVVFTTPATYTLLELDAAGGVISSTPFFAAPAGGGVNVPGRHPEVVSCAGTVYLATPATTGNNAQPSMLLTSDGTLLWSAETGRSIGGLACDGSSGLYVTTTGGDWTNYLLHHIDASGSLLTTTEYFDSDGYGTRTRGIQPEVASCAGTVYLATPGLIDLGGGEGERSDLPSTVRTAAGAVLWSGGAGEDVGGLACDGDGGVYAMVMGGDPIGYELVRLSSTGTVLEQTPTFDSGGASYALAGIQPEVASCLGFE